jgi:hypothetical protein
MLTVWKGAAAVLLGALLAQPRQLQVRTATTAAAAQSRVRVRCHPGSNLMVCLLSPKHHLRQQALRLTLGHQLTLKRAHKQQALAQKQHLLTPPTLIAEGAAAAVLM